MILRILTIVLLGAFVSIANAQVLIDPMSESANLVRIGTRCAGSSKIITDNRYDYVIGFSVRKIDHDMECYQVGWGPQGYKCDFISGGYGATMRDHDGNWSSEGGSFLVKKQTYPKQSLSFQLFFGSRAWGNDLNWDATSEFSTLNQKWTETEVTIPVISSQLCDGPAEHIYKREKRN